MTIGGDTGGELRPPLMRRLRPGHWIGLDCLAAAAAAALLIDSVERQSPFFGMPRAAAVAIAACVALPVTVRRLWPRTALGVILAGTVAAGVAGFSTDPPVAVALVLYLVPLRLPRPAAVRLLAGTVITVAAVIVAQMCLVAVTRHDSFWAATMAARLLASGLMLTAAWMIGYAVRQQRAYTAGLREQAERQAAQQVAEARRSITEERLRIARELHDVVAHGLSLIAVQAGVASYVMDARPEEAARALSSIEQTSRGALAEMRTLLGVLRADEPPGLAPVPGLAALGQLTERASAAGVRVDVEIRGLRRQPPAGIDLAAYRVIQEALTNVVKHAAAGTCRVLLTYGDDDLTVEITDRGQGGFPGRPVPGRDDGGSGGSGGGHGIAGMRERVTMYGGQFEAGPLPGHGFRVAARLPLAVASP